MLIVKTMVRLDWCDAQADLSRHLALRLFCKFCHVPAQIGLCFPQERRRKTVKWSLLPRHQRNMMTVSGNQTGNQSSRDRSRKWHVCPAKTPITLGIRPVWSESLLCTQWVAKDPSFFHADSEDSDQNGRMPRLIWVFAECTCHFVLSWGDSVRGLRVVEEGSVWSVFSRFSWNSTWKCFILIFVNSLFTSVCN